MDRWKPRAVKVGRIVAVLGLVLLVASSLRHVDTLAGLIMLLGGAGAVYWGSDWDIHAD